MSDPCLLIGDIGGTNARFAFAHPDGPGFFNELILSCADYETSEQAIAAYLERSGGQRPDTICLAVAGPVMDNKVDVINNHWEIDGQQLRSSFSANSVRLLNDFEAIAYSLPLLAGNDVSTIGLVPSTVDGSSEFTLGVLGPGTGLGVGACLAGAAGFTRSRARAAMRVLRRRLVCNKRC